MNKLITILFLLVSLASFSQKQDSLITIIGVVVDAETGENIPFANMILFDGKKQLGVVQTDFDGKFKLKTKKENSIKVSYIGSIDTIIEAKKLMINSTIELVFPNKIDTITYIDESLVELDYPAKGKELTAEDIEQLPIRSQSDCIFKSDSKVKKRNKNLIKD